MGIDIPEAVFPGLILELGRSPDDVFNRSFYTIVGLLILVVVAAFFFGGSVLLWLARRAAVEAQQKTDFLSNISHELKTPLTTIRMYAEMLEEGRVTAEEKVKRYLQTIGTETQRLSRLVNNILQFSALQKGRNRLNLQEVELTELTRHFLDAQLIRLRGSGIGLEQDLGDAAIRVSADPDAIEQALLNLLDNVVKYADGSDRVTCRIRTETGLVKILVEDEGPGIPREQRERVFEAFHRIDNSLTSSKPGSGLGLSITQSLMRQMGGDLIYEPNEPRGSRFILILPRSNRTSER